MRLQWWRDRTVRVFDRNSREDVSVPSEYADAYDPAAFPDEGPSAREGWFAEYSALGFTDVTDWTGPHDSPAAAIVEAFDAFGNADDPADRREVVEALRSVGCDDSQVCERLGITCTPQHLPGLFDCTAELTAWLEGGEL